IGVGRSRTGTRLDDHLVAQLDQLLHGLRSRRHTGLPGPRLLGYAKSHRHSSTGVLWMWVAGQPTTRRGESPGFVMGTMVTRHNVRRSATEADSAGTAPATRAQSAPSAASTAGPSSSRSSRSRASSR